MFGLIIMVMIYATGHLSGAHINPSVTIAFTLTRHFSPRDAIAYIAAQLTGATLAALVLLGVWPSKPAHLGATVPTVAAGSAFVYEAILTAFLVFVIMAVATDTRAVGAAAAIAIGGVIGLDALFGGPVTGASMNPARSFGPALVSSTWTDFWVYVAGPIVGAVVGALAYRSFAVSIHRGLSTAMPRSSAMAHVLFVCLRNAGRSQMSQALFERGADGRHTAASAGTTPAERVHPEVVEVMRELGIDLADRRPQLLTRELAEQADVVVTMGCGDQCPFIPGKRYIDWELRDPEGQPVDEVRATRDEIARRVQQLFTEPNASP